MTCVALSALFVAAFALATPAVAQSASSENDDNRYTFNRAEDGYLRLDGRTGQVSLCTRRTVGWACLLVPDERTALELEVARLQNENAALKKDLLARNLPLPGVVKPDQPGPKPEEPRLQLPERCRSQQVDDLHRERVAATGRDDRKHTEGRAEKIMTAMRRTETVGHRLSAVTSMAPELLATAMLVVETGAPGFTEITREAVRFVAAAGGKDGALLLFLRHTSASLVI